MTFFPFPFLVKDSAFFLFWVQDFISYVSMGFQVLSKQLGNIGGEVRQGT